MSMPLDHIVLYAATPERSARFHGLLLGLLGFEKRRDHVFARDGLFIDIRESTIDSPVHERGMRGVDHIGFRSGSIADVHDIRERLLAAGEEGGRVIEFDNGDVALFVADPDGLRIEITCYADPASDPVD